MQQPHKAYNIIEQRGRDLERDVHLLMEEWKHGISKQNYQQK